MLPSYGQDKRLDLAPGKEVHQGQNPNALPLQEPKVARVPGDQGSRMGRKRDLRDRWVVGIRAGSQRALPDERRQPG